MIFIGRSPATTYSYANIASGGRLIKGGGSQTPTPREPKRSKLPFIATIIGIVLGFILGTVMFFSR